MLRSFYSFLTFELQFWMKSMMVWVFLFIMTGLLTLVLQSDQDIMVDVFFGHAYRNSAFVIQRLYGMTAVFGCLMVTAFVNAAASRDFAYETQQLIFTKPIHKAGYLLGRFVGSLLVSLIPMMGASLAVIIAETFSSGADWGPRQWHAHLWSILVIAIPNTFLVGAIVFSIAVWTRNTLASFLGILGLLIGITIASAISQGLELRSVAALLDPFADEAINRQTQYWTVEDKNTQTVQLTGLLLYNRLLWLGVAAASFALGYWRFSFTLKESLISRLWRNVRHTIAASLVTPGRTVAIPVVHRYFGLTARLQQLGYLIGNEFWQTWRSPIFICIMVGALFVTFTNFSMQTSAMFGVTTLPVTFNMVESVRNSLFQFLLALITFYAGVFVWKERDARLDEIYDALPIPTGLTFVAKLVAMYAVVFSVILVGIVCGIGYQLINQYYAPQLGLYVSELLGWDMVQISCLIFLAFLCHVISPNKYVGYFLYIGLFVANLIGWNLLQVRSNMFQFGDLPNYVYSDLFGREPYLPILRWFATYWLLLAMVVGFVCVLFWPRGRERGIQRLTMARTRWRGVVGWGSLATITLWVLTGAWIFYNTLVINTVTSLAEDRKLQGQYEKEHKAKQQTAQPRVVEVRYDIDLFPEQRRLTIDGKQTIKNQSETPIKKIYVTVNRDFEVRVTIDGASLAEKDDADTLWTYRADPPILPGETRQMTFQVNYEPSGFENSLGFSGIVQNGTFFNSGLMPQIGYQPNLELREDDDREEAGLKGQSITRLDPDNLEARSHTYISNNSDWVDVETVISTSGDQTAVAPGSLVDFWKKDGRNYFHYRLDHPSLNFYSFVSARYAVKTRQMGDIDLEVYYHPDHQWNVDLMLNSMRRSLEYYTENFGPYRHHQARIVEFPRVASFAQAFPGTMPYSEGIGFIADLTDPKDIDMVFYVVAHEMAHQWWAHQVIGANMQGATVLSETLAQYSALMVMEKEYGRDQMRKFLQYEMDNYLRARGRSKRAEQPLQSVDFDQGYIHYNKGSLAMYLLKETIGEKKVNQALRALVDQYAYQGPPYPTSLDLVNQLRNVTPQEHQSLIDDLFEHITLFDNRTTSATYRKIGKQYEVTMTVDFRKLRADEFGKETEVPLDDWIEIGAFARPKSGELGETLYRERFHITEATRTFTFRVDSYPAKVGVDPISLLIDRNKTDNMIEPDRAEAN